MREVKDRAVTALVLGIISLVIPFIALITGPIGWWCQRPHRQRGQRLSAPWQGHSSRRQSVLDDRHHPLLSSCRLLRRALDPLPGRQLGRHLNSQTVPSENAIMLALLPQAASSDAWHDGWRLAATTPSATSGDSPSQQDLPKFATQEVIF